MNPKINETHREDEIDLNGTLYHIIYDAEWDKGDVSTGWPAGYIITVHAAFDDQGDDVELSAGELDEVESILADRLENE